MLDENSIPTPHEPIAPNLLREQELSGLCTSPSLSSPSPSPTTHTYTRAGSPMCFVLAAFNYPGAIRAAWGRLAEQLDAETWDLLDGPGTAAVQNDRGLGMLLKMTRCADLGLGEMFFPDDEDVAPEDEGEGEGEGEDEGSEEEEDYGVEVGVRDVGALSSLGLTLGHDLGVGLRTPSHEQDPGRLVQGVNALSLAA